jgi:hypothetical protein
VQKYKLRERGVTPTAWDRQAASAREGLSDGRVLERRARDDAVGDVERWQAEQVTAMLPALRRRSRLYARLHAGVPEDLAVRSAADLAALPLTLKDDLRVAQQAASEAEPLGDNQAVRAPTSSRRSRRRARPGGRSTTA